MTISTLSPEDFKQLPKDGARFEALVCQLLESMGYRILEKPAVGTEGGRDVLVERTLKDIMGERREKVVVQCKHHAHSGKAVGDNDIGVWENAMKRYKARGYLLVTDVRVTENLSKSFREFTNDDANFPQWADFWDVDKLIALLNENPKVRDSFFSLKLGSQTPLQELADEVRTWLKAVRYEVEDVQGESGNRLDFIAIFKQGTVKQQVLVRCVGGEIIPKEIDDLSTLLNLQTSQGWLVSDQRVSRRARRRAEAISAIRVFNLSELLQEMIWSGYFEYLQSAVKESKIQNLYIDPSCYKLDKGEDRNNDGRERYESLDRYMDSWVAERGKMHISLLGEFGSGKTWFCYHYAHLRLKRYLENPAKERLPLLITLRSFTKSMTAQQLINDALLEQYKLPLVGSAYEVFQELNRRGKVLLILDGFDEMARQVDYQTVVDNFWELAALVEDSSKVILTSRTEYFRAASESEKVLGGEELGRKTKELKPPKFEVLYIEPFSDAQIRDVIINRLGANEGSEVAEKILRDENLAAIARKPVLIELLLAALDEVSADVLENTAYVYLYATNKLLLRNITAEKTFTSMADKLFFLCELAWEMIFSGELRIHYKEIPSRIQQYFGEQIKDEHILDTWDFDLRNQTLLHRNAAGYYEFAHKSLAEYFVAFKFAAEIDCLASDFKTTYCEAAGSPCILPFKDKELPDLAKSFGAFLLNSEAMEAVFTLLKDIVSPEDKGQLWALVNKTIRMPLSEVQFVGSNSLKLLQVMGESFSGRNLAGTVLVGADLNSVDLQGTDIRGAVLDMSDMSNNTLRECSLSESVLEGAILTHCDMEGLALEGCNLSGAKLENSIIARVSFKGANLSNVGIVDPPVTALTWSTTGKNLTAGTADGTVAVWNSIKGELLGLNRGNGSSVGLLALSGSKVAYDRGKTISVWDVETNRVVVLQGSSVNLATNNIYLSKCGRYVSASRSSTGGVKVWETSTGNELASFEANAGWCNCAAFLEDATMILTTGYGGEFKIWDWAKGALISSIKIPDAGNIHSVTLSASNHRLMAIVRYPDSSGSFGSSRIARHFVWSFPDFLPIMNLLIEPEDKLGRVTFHYAGMSSDGSKGILSYKKFSAKNINSLTEDPENLQREDDEDSHLIVQDLGSDILSAEINHQSIMPTPLQPRLVRLSDDGNMLVAANKNSALLFKFKPSSLQADKIIKTFTVRLDCGGVDISNAQGLESHVQSEGQSCTLREFFLDRGASFS